MSPHSGHFIPGKKAPGMKPHFKQMDRMASMVGARPLEAMNPYGVHSEVYGGQALDEERGA